jgi:hypothetical protein
MQKRGEKSAAAGRDPVHSQRKQLSAFSRQLSAEVQTLSGLSKALSADVRLPLKKKRPAASPTKLLAGLSYILLY